MRQFGLVRQLDERAAITVDDPVPYPLLRTKLRPVRLPATVAPRRRLSEAVSRAVHEFPLTVISALPGSGKSVLASSWAQQRPAHAPVGWLSLDPADNHGERFWPYAVEAMRSAGLPRDRLTGWDGKNTAVDQSMLARLAAGLLDAPRPVVLVLDDFQAITGAGIEQGLDFLLRYAYPKFRLVIVTRIDPALPIHRYRLAGDVAEIRQPALDFTADEISEYAAALGMTMAEQTVRRLSSATDGWAAGVRSAILDLDVPAPCPESHVGQSTAISEFVQAEVLDALSAPARQFLLVTSVSERVSPQLADELTGRGDGEPMLAYLAHHNVVVEQPGGRTAMYRASALIRQVALAQFTREAPAEAAELHRRCAVWFAARRQPLAALAHAVAGQHWDWVLDSVIESVTIGRVLVSNDNGRYAAILAEVPDDLPGGAAAVVRAAAGYLRRDHDVVDRELTLARPRIESGDGSPRLQLSLHLLNGVVSVRDGDGRVARTAAEASASALSALCDDGGRANTEERALVQLARAAGLLWDGAESDAVAEFELALQLSTQTGSRELTLTCRGLLALAEALRGHLLRARELAQPVTLGADVAPSRHVAASLAMAWVCAEQYDRTQSRRFAEQLDAEIGGSLGLVLVLLRSRMLRWRGDLGGARRLLEDYRSACTSGALISARLRLEEFELHLMAGRADQAIAVLDTDDTSPRMELARARGHATEQGPRFLSDEFLDNGATPLDVQVEAWLHQCRSHLGCADERSAASALTRAVELARPQLMRRPFLDSGPLVRRFLREQVAADVSQWLDPRPLRAGAARHEATRGALPTAVVVERLSEREMDVLRHLAEPRSTEEIAAAMFVSINTVRSHVRSILRKLDVSRRNDAIRRARDLHLI